MSKIKSLLLDEKVVSFEFPGCPGLEFDLAYLSKDEVLKIQKKCTKTTFENRTRSQIDKVDDKLFLELYVGKIIKGWRGFKMKYLPEFVLADISTEEEDGEIEYDKETALELMQQSSILDSWVSDQITDLGKFNISSTKKSLDSLKNM